MLSKKNIIIIVSILLIYFCIIKPKQENFNQWMVGDGIGGNDTKIGTINTLPNEKDYEKACIDMVVGKRPDANGASLEMKGKNRDCYAEINMDSRDYNKNVKSLMFSQDKKPYNKISDKFLIAKRYNKTPCEYWATRGRCNNPKYKKFMAENCGYSCLKRKSCINNLQLKKCDYLVDCSRRLNRMFTKRYCENYKIGTK